MICPIQSTDDFLVENLIPKVMQNFKVMLQKKLGTDDSTLITGFYTEENYDEWFLLCKPVRRSS